MRIIAFDLGATMAYAYEKHCYHQTFTGERAERLSAIGDWLDAIGWHRFSVVVYETPFARGRDATRSLWGIAGILEAVVTDAALPVVDVAVPTIKKFATGDGRASKVEMIAAARRMGYTGNNEHEADAVCLLRYAEANLEKA